MSKTAYLVENLLKRNQINTVVGPSGSGKSKWVTSQLAAMHNRELFLGRQTEPLPETLYISLDRSQLEAESLMQHAGLASIPNLRFYSWRSSLRDLGTFHLFTQSLKRLERQPELLIIDGIGFLVKDIIKQREVGILFGDFDSWQAANPNTTVILIHHTAKAKEGQKYKRRREQGLGSGAWGQCSSMYISIATKTDDPDCADREAVIERNDGPSLVVPFFINEEGKIVPGFPIDAEIIDDKYR